MKSQSWLTQLGLFDNEQWTPMKRVKNNVNQCFCQWVPMKTMVSNRIGPITPGKFRESSWKDPFEQWSKHLLIVWIGTMNLLRNSWCDPQKIETCFQDEMAMIFPQNSQVSNFLVHFLWYSISSVYPTNYSHTNNIGFILYAFIIQKLPVPQDISSGVCSSPFFTTYIPLISDEISPLN